MVRGQRDSMLGWNPINNRLCTIRLKGKFRNISLISAYAPTEDHPDEEKDNFHDILARECGTLLKYDAVVLLGDFKVTIRKEGFARQVAGKNTLHEITSDSGRRLI